MAPLSEGVLSDGKGRDKSERHLHPPNTCSWYIEATILPEGSSIMWLKDAPHLRHQKDMSCSG